MDIEFFTETGRGFAPKASIRRQGQIGLNQGAINRFGIKNGQYVLLGYDRTNKIVALKLTNESEKGAKRINVKEKNGSISAKSFFDFFAIPYDKTTAYELKEDQVKDLLVFYIETSQGENIL